MPMMIRPRIRQPDRDRHEQRLMIPRQKTRRHARTRTPHRLQYGRAFAIAAPRTTNRRAAGSTARRSRSHEPNTPAHSRPPALNSRRLFR
jgi:hypothetical protein